MSILYFEFSDFFRHIVKDIISQNGHDVVESKFGKDLYKLLAMHDVEMVFTGFELADMTGEELIRELKHSKYEDIPVIIITSADIEEAKERLKGLKIDDYILKEDLTIEKLNDCIKRLELRHLLSK